MTCEGKDLDHMDMVELEEAHRFHGWGLFNSSGEIAKEKQVANADRLGKIHVAYLNRFGPEALMKLVANLKEMKER